MNLARVPLLGRLSPRRRMLAVAVTLLLVATVALVGVRTLGRSAVPVADQGRPGSVILVPGYGGSQGSLASLAAAISTTGRRAVIVALPGNGDGDLQAQADALATAVSTEVAAGAPSVDLVGYSAGGVVVRLFVARFAGADSVRRVVTLGSPLHGAAIAGVGAALVPGACPVACQQLAPGSSLLTQLDATPVPARLPWLSVWTRDDQTVTPPDSARLTGAVNVMIQDVCPDAVVAHGQLPSDPLVTGLVLRAVAVAPSGPPTPADCAPLRQQGRR